MKVFVDPEGKFAIKIPVEWEYKNILLKSDKSTPHSFELYDNPKGCFQISYHNKDKGNVPKLISNNKLRPQKAGIENLIFAEKVILGGVYDLYLWMALVEDTFFLIKYIIDGGKRVWKSTQKELEKVKKSLPTLLYIKPEDRDSFLETDRFKKFMYSIIACIDLKNRAWENGSFLELVLLISNHIDALLRLSLILHYQLQDKNKKIDTSLIFQGETDKPIMEKKIYKMALNEGIINQSVHDELFGLYNERNKVVHRYIITDIKTRDVMNIVIDYGKILEKVELVVSDLEQKQFMSKIGLFGTDAPPGAPDELGISEIIASVKDKHGNKKMNKEMTIKK